MLRPECHFCSAPPTGFAGLGALRGVSGPRWRGTRRAVPPMGSFQGTTSVGVPSPSQEGMFIIHSGAMSRVCLRHMLLGGRGAPKGAWICVPRRTCSAQTWVARPLVPLDCRALGVQSTPAPPQGPQWVLASTRPWHSDFCMYGLFRGRRAGCERWLLFSEDSGPSGESRALG